MERKMIFMTGFVIGIVAGILVTSIINVIVAALTKPIPVGDLLVDKTDKEMTALYLDLDKKPEVIGDCKYVSMKVKVVDYFGTVEKNS